MSRAAPAAPQPGESVWRTALEALGAKRRLLPLVIGLGILAAALEGAGIGLIVPVLSIILEGNEASGFAARLFAGLGAGLPPETRLFMLGGLIILLVALKNVVAYINALLVSHLYGSGGHRTRTTLAERILSADFGFLLAERPGRILNVLSNESWRVADAIQVFLKLAVAASAAAIFGVILVLLSWQLALVAAIGFVVVQALHYLLSVRLKPFGRVLADTNREMASAMLHLVHSGRVVRLFQQERVEADRFAHHSDNLRKAALALDRRSAALPALTELLHVILFFGIIIAAWASGTSFPLIASFVILLYRMQPQLREIQTNWSLLHGWSGSLEEVRSVTEGCDSARAPSGERPFTGLGDAITFESVDFAYPGLDRRQVLHDVDFTIRAGRATALVGRSGSGKSTVVNLLCRLLAPSGGRIMVDGVDLTDIDPFAWRSHIALASQDLELAEGTVADNIAYGMPGATQAQIERAAIMAEAHAFIAALPQGYDTWLGYRGAFVSEGQRQRLALARALVREPEILILDEATNALDGISEAAIIETLKTRVGRGTTIVISHHRKTLAFCDDIVLLRDGRVISSPQDDLERVFEKMGQPAEPLAALGGIGPR
jgi:ATP-binding cassette, subfamily B, bacterial MsbA